MAEVKPSKPVTVLATGLVYFVVVFAIAFAMGVARVLFIAPRLGPTAAVLLEVPLLVAASWFVARRLIHGRSFTVLQLFGSAASLSR